MTDTLDSAPLRSLAPVLGALALTVAPACGQVESAEKRTSIAEVDANAVAAQIGSGDRWKTDFSRISVPPDEIVSGGPPKDGIPAIDEPAFESLTAADVWLADSEPIVVIERNDAVKAYPLAILIWHEIVNDNVGGLPIAVTFCPLCNTALAFEREVAGRTLDFGTTGRLRHSDLIMYDRQTETWWQQAVGVAIVGELLDTTLELVPANTFSWETVKRLHPEAIVLSRDTGHRRDYGRNPYVGYDDPDGSPIPMFFAAETDPQLPAMERIVAVDIGAGWAVPYGRLSDVRLVNDAAEDLEMLVVWTPGASSAVDESRTGSGRDVGQTAVFDRRVGERTLTFEWTDDGLRDVETGSTWNLAGRAEAGPLKGERLRRIPHGNHFWFSWVVFRPETRVWSNGGGEKS